MKFFQAFNSKKLNAIIIQSNIYHTVYACTEQWTSAHVLDWLTNILESGNEETHNGRA